MALLGLPNTALRLGFVLLASGWFGSSEDAGHCEASGGAACSANAGDLPSCSTAAQLSGCGSARPCSELLPGQVLAPGEWLSSPNGEFVATLSGSELVVQAASSAGEPVWSTQSAPSENDSLVACVAQGRLVLTSADRSVWASPARSAFVRFTVVSTRYGDVSKLPGTQISEISLWNRGSAVDLQGAVVSSPGSSPGNQGPQNAIDGKTSTKWYERDKSSQFTLLFDSAIQADQFSFTTADDVPARDPLRWKLESSADGQTWNELHVQKNAYATPQERFTTTEKFSLDPPLNSQVGEIDVSALRLVLTDTGALVLKVPDGAATWSSGSRTAAARPVQRQEPPESEDSRKMRRMNECAEYLSCAQCIASQPPCGWCIATRRCVADEPWICQGDEDHVSRPGSRGPGTRQCPSLQEVEDQHRQRRERAAAAALPPGDPADSSGSSSVGERSDSDSVGARPRSLDAEDAGSEEKSDHQVDPALRKELGRRARMAEDEQGTRPYEVLGVKTDVSTSGIRKAYRRLSIQFHPDKWVRSSDSLRRQAEVAFADIQKAYETIGAPDKRAMFDEYHGDNFGKHWDDSSQGRGDEDFYFGDPFIATLTEQLWERRLAGSTIWLIEFYAAWCPGCRNSRQSFRELARKLENVSIEVGAVNCVRQSRICGEYVGITAYPSIRLLNREFGMMQNWQGKGGIEVDGIYQWANDVSREWRWLLRHANVHWDLGKSSFSPGGAVADSERMWVVSFIDGRECPSCKAVCTNLQRLSASLRGLPVEIGAVDCSLPEHRDFCYREHEVPAPPHRPLTKAWRSGVKNATGAAEPGELLYSPADLEPHTAFALVEKLVRLAFTDRLESAALDEAAGARFEGEQEEDDEPPPPGSTGGAPAPSGFRGPRIAFEGETARKLPKPWQTWQGASTPQINR